MAVWAEVDVGGLRKGFHVAALDERRIVLRPTNVASVAETVELLEWLAPPRGRGRQPVCSCA